MHPGLAASIGGVGGDLVKSLMVLEVHVTIRRSELLKRPAICNEMGLVGTRMGRRGVGGAFFLLWILRALFIALSIKGGGYFSLRKVLRI